MSNLGARRITSRIYDLTRLKSLNLSYNYLRRIHPDIQYLSRWGAFVSFKSLCFITKYFGLNRLEVLNIAHNRLQTLPMELCELNNLTELNASYNQISTFSGHLYRLVKLQHLNLSYNSFVDLPVETGNLELLQELRLFEVGISQYQQLQFLDLSHCNFSTWPSRVHLLKSLEILHLSHNSIPFLPTEIEDMESLHTLAIGHNQLTELPSTLYHLHLKVREANHIDMRSMVWCYYVCFIGTRG
jgi:leucine-rich repeat protein SHOC2